MKISIFTTALILIACIANAGNIDGKWEGFLSNDPDMKLTFTFKSDGKKLTGTMIGFRIKTVDIQNGEIEGNKISFEVPMKRPGMEMASFYTGELSGDDLKLSFITKFDGTNINFIFTTEGEDSPDSDSHQQTLVCKRVKNGG